MLYFHFMPFTQQSDLVSTGSTIQPVKNSCSLSVVALKEIFQVWGNVWKVWWCHEVPQLETDRDQECGLELIVLGGIESYQIGLLLHSYKVAIVSRRSTDTAVKKSKKHLCSLNGMSHVQIVLSSSLKVSGYLNSFIFKAHPVTEVSRELSTRDSKTIQDYMRTEHQVLSPPLVSLYWEW